MQNNRHAEGLAMDSESGVHISRYVDQNPVGVLGTINDDGTPHGAVVYACVIDGILYFLTKTGTRKFTNLINRPAVSLTIGNSDESSTLQVSGHASVVNDAAQIDAAMKKLTQVHASMPDWLPPIAKLRAGQYSIVQIEMTHARLAEFKNRSIGSERIFTEI